MTVRRAAFLLLVPLAGAVAAQTRAEPGIYTCKDPKTGAVLTSDRPILQCTGVEQRILNRDGSQRGIVPPTLTADERAEREAAQRAEDERRLARQELVRQDRQLKARYPNEAAHERAREQALDVMRASILTSEQRLKDLAAARKPLLEEAEFYASRPMPAKLRQQIDENEALTQAQRDLVKTQQAELGRINRRFDAELQRLRQLWAGAQPGTLGPLATNAASAAAR